MPWVLLIDGYNVIAPVARPGRQSRWVSASEPDPLWLHRERMLLIQRLADALPKSVHAKTCVVFDARNPPPDRSDSFTERGISIRFAVDHPEADDLLEEIIRAHHSPKRLMVVSSDHRVQSAAKRRGAQTCDSQQWLDDLLDGKVRLAIKIPRSKQERAGDLTTMTTSSGQPNETGGAGQGGSKPSGGISADEVSQWLDEFGFDRPDRPD
ncbi:NYN domain-containing protein [Stieleria varia]|uniref:YacP-like NYN domain protein n=1 Tax=Stieleria varia TaxID=2528005 RepID=A0A5C6AFU2_9BACT|nr:NYN domain-containing protein [Stieleria varia]TWT98310.1 YacP-like NYN domain protein [Stieleria varia]